MRRRVARWLTCLSGALVAASAACTPVAVQQRGRPEALAPLLGARGLGGGAPRTKPTEPVEDYWIDLAALAPAWPEARTELPRLVQAVIARGSWLDEHHTVETAEGALRVRHRPDVVAQVRRLVEGLRARLLWPLEIHLALVEVGAPALERALPLDRARGERRWSAAGFRAAVDRGEARALTRIALTAHNGQWATSERVSNQSYLAGVTVNDGAVTPRTIALASGYTVQAAAWRWGEDRAVVALSHLYTGEAAGSQTVAQQVHRALPARKKDEHEWEPHEVRVDLPVRDLLELQAQLAVGRGEWTVAALLPRDRKRLCAALVKVDWASPVPAIGRVDPLSGRGYVLEVVPVALPTDQGPQPVSQAEIFLNRREISANAVSWFKDRARQVLESQKKNIYNFQSESGTMDFSLNPAAQQLRSAKLRSRGGAESGSAGVMPEPLERLREEVLQAEWPEGSALEFVANQVFVVHSAAVAAKARTLLEQTHTWRNRRVVVDVAFPTFAAGAADELRAGALSAERAAALRRGEVLLPAAYLLGRGGSRTEMFVGEMHAVLAEAWAADRSSPSVVVYWRGARLSAEPQLGAAAAQGLELAWQQHRLEKVAPHSVAGAVLQQPVDALWRHTQRLQLDPGLSALVGLSSEGSKLQSLLVSATRR